jgi:hypothetical protein
MSPVSLTPQNTQKGSSRKGKQVQGKVSITSSTRGNPPPHLFKSWNVMLMFALLCSLSLSLSYKVLCLAREVRGCHRCASFFLSFFPPATVQLCRRWAMCLDPHLFQIYNEHQKELAISTAKLRKLQDECEYVFCFSICFLSLSLSRLID